jgi:hypothetical protein
VCHRYRRDDGIDGLVNLWPHDGRIVLTWEECRDGDQFNESNYTRDEVRRFDTIEEAITFLEGSGIPPESFTGC